MSPKKDPPEIDPLASFPDKMGPVLLSDQIEFYCDRKNLDPPLIENFSIRCLKPARYNLRLGSIAHIEGRRLMLDEKTPLILEPHQVAIVQTFESVNLPRFLIARWNLTVDMVYEGLLWVGALQVDPGWQGSLPCPVYNLANRTIELQYQQKLFTIDFVRTTPYVKDKSETYGYVSKPYPKRDDIDVANHDKNRLRSAVSATVDKVDSLSRTVFTFMTAGLTGFAILFAALGILSTASIPADSIIGTPLLSTVVPISAIAFVAAIIAIVLSSYAATRERIPLRFRKSWPRNFVGSLGVVSLVWGVYTLLAPNLHMLFAVTPQWILNLPSPYGAVHVVVGFVLGWIYRLSDPTLAP